MKGKELTDIALACGLRHVAQPRHLAQQELSALCAYLGLDLVDPATLQRALAFAQEQLGAHPNSPTEIVRACDPHPESSGGTARVPGPGNPFRPQR